MDCNSVRESESRRVGGPSANGRGGGEELVRRDIGREPRTGVPPPPPSPYILSRGENGAQLAAERPNAVGVVSLFVIPRAPRPLVILVVGQRKFFVDGAWMEDEMKWRTP